MKKKDIAAWLLLIAVVCFLTVALRSQVVTPPAGGSSLTVPNAAVLNGNGSVLGAATALTIGSLWSGCSGSQGLGVDGACHTYGGSPSGVSGDFQINNGTGGFGTGHMNDTGTVINSTEQLNATTGLTVGSSPPTLTPGTGGAEAVNEGTAPSAGPASSVDVCYSDSTQHGRLCNYNNVGYLPLIQGPASNVANNVAAFTGTNGGKVIDSLVPYTSLMWLKATPLTPAADTLSCATINTTETSFASDYTVPANYAAQGKVLALHASFAITSTATPTFVIRLRWGGTPSSGTPGGTVISSTTATAPPTASSAHNVRYDWMLVPTGTSGQISTQAIYPLFTGTGDATTQPVSSLTVNSNQNIVITLNCSGNTAGNSLQLLALWVEGN